MLEDGEECWQVSSLARLPAQPQESP